MDMVGGIVVDGAGVWDTASALTFAIAAAGADRVVGDDAATGATADEVASRTCWGACAVAVEAGGEDGAGAEARAMVPGGGSGVDCTVLEA
jgi:hypothetical protein